MFAFRLISYLPLWALYILSDFFYLIAYHVIGYRKNIVQKNIEHAFPEKSPQEVKKIMGEFYRNLTDSFAETIKLLTMDKREIQERFKVNNKELLTGLLEKGEIVVGLTSHFFNWEGQSLTAKVCIDPRFETVYLKVNNPFFEQLMRAIRSRFGGYLVERSQFQRNFIKNRNTPRVIGLAADQRPNREDKRYWTTFMNRKTGFFEGAEKLAKRFELATVFSKVEKVKRGHYEFTFLPLSLPPHDNREHSITEKYIQLTEENIRQQPALYLWSHNRWKNSK